MGIGSLYTTFHYLVLKRRDSQDVELQVETVERFKKMKMKEIVREYCDCRKPNLVPLFIFKFPSKTDKPKKIFFIFPIISSALFCYKISFFRHLSRAGMLQGCPFPPIWSEGHLDVIYKNFLTVRVPGSSLQTAAALIIYYFILYV